MTADDPAADDAPAADDLWTDEVARAYDTPGVGMFASDVLDPTVDALAALAGGGRALEFAVGTGRVAVPLAARGIDVSGIEFSPAMARVLRDKVGDEIPVVLGDMATATAPGRFALVYLVFNTITNLLDQDAQVACFQNAARHLEPGGAFVIEVGMPDLRRLPPSQLLVPYGLTDERVDVDRYDLVRQRLVSHHYLLDGDRVTRFFTEHRYVWPAELDLMARLAGMSLERRTADWTGAPFTGESTSHVSVWRLPGVGT